MVSGFETSLSIARYLIAMNVGSRALHSSLTNSRHSKHLTQVSENIMLSKNNEILKINKLQLCLFAFYFLELLGIMFPVFLCSHKFGSDTIFIQD